MSPVQADPSSSTRDAVLLAQARDAFLPGLSDVFAAAVARYDDVLFDRAEHAGGSQLLFLDGMRELRRHREEIATRFRTQLGLAWQSLEMGAPLSAEAALSSQASGLSLVPEHELESRLAVRNLAGVILRDCKQVLARLDRRLGWIAGGLELEADSNPLGPEHIGVAVHEAFANCELAPEVRLVLIKLCERDLAPAVSKLYELLDQRLVRAGVLPGGPATARPRARPAAPASAAEPLFDQVPEEPHAGYGGGWAEQAGDEHSPAWATRFMQRWGETRGAMQGAGGFDAPQGHAPGPAGGAPGMLLDALHQLLQQSRELRGGAEQAAGSVHAAQSQQRPLSQREMLSVLSLLQATPSATLRAAIGDERESLSQRLKSEVLSNASQLGMDPSSTRLDPKDEDAIDLVGMLFDVLLDERDLAGRPRELIGRLVVPFVKVALLDRRMFVQKTHPARRLLNALAEACEGNQGESAAERTLLAKVEEVIERLVTEFNENLAIFMTLEEEFRDFLEQHRRRVEITERRATEIQRGQERLELARTRAQSELAMRTEDLHLPQAVADFLRNPWQHHVTLSLLRDGEDGEAFVEAMALADGLLDEVAEAQRHIVGKPWLQAWQPGLRKVFASIGLHGDAADAAIGALHDTLQAVAAARPELEKPLPELPEVALPQPAAVEQSPIELVGGTDTLDFDNADAARIRSLPVGTWLDFIDKDGRVQPGKLSWISPISSRLLFVNRRGVRFCVASPEELAVMVRLGRLRSHVVDDGAFDSAMQGVIDRLDTPPPPPSVTLH
ncbi:thymidine phosphorylase [Pseudoxanthomonas broegbernensis]|uniref:Thymidine phosphorylase n=1 Tax=Pseudoxanthomonas broegbernensis TaxID=83619 RepID=A0A7V8GMD9_9GAMM|nr:DUF1631 domain-containing protein [Pseudoxanthomonas broegbernensis]KAF1686436.1 thymidine phosphorylase [Pseudoxanthomonas broegbernensis]MBB6064313.1 hypothetical protein [Pseudoxanthomonas broegbernensis]